MYPRQIQFKMPKVPSSTKEKLNKFVSEFGRDIFSSDGTILFCKVCEKSVNFDKKFHVSQHLNGKYHKDAALMKKNEKKSCMLTSFVQMTARESQFSMDLCSAFVNAGIPLWKIQNKFLKEFLKKYTKEKVPCESTLRKTYLEKAYLEKIIEIRQAVKTSKIWVSIDETTDAVGR